MTTPVPIGVGASFSPVRTDSVRTGTFFISGGENIVTFQPVNVNDPGVVTLYDSGDNALLTMNMEGYETFQGVAGGATGYYFKATKGANLLAVTHPSIWR